MGTPESITQHTSIRDADTLLSIEPIVVRSEDALQFVAETATKQPGARVISVVNPAGSLVGVIPVRVLVNEIFLKIVPEQFLGEIVDYDQVLSYAGHIGARTAGDIMLDPVSVRLDDTVREAFARMHQADLIGLPITDDANAVVGYVDQLELLMVWVRACGLDSMLGPTPPETT